GARDVDARVRGVRREAAVGADVEHLHGVLRRRRGIVARDEEEEGDAGAVDERREAGWADVGRERRPGDRGEDARRRVDRERGDRVRHGVGRVEEVSRAHEAAEAVPVAAPLVRTRDEGRARDRRERAVRADGEAGDAVRRVAPGAAPVEVLVEERRRGAGACDREREDGRHDDRGARTGHARGASKIGTSAAARNVVRPTRAGAPAQAGCAARVTASRFRRFEPREPTVRRTRHARPGARPAGPRPRLGTTLASSVGPPRMRLASPWLAAALAATLAALPARAADVNRDLDSYALLAGTSLRAKRLRVVSGDVGVSAGSLRVSGSFDAAQSQVVASEAHLGRAACARLFANRARGGGTGCGHAVGFSAPILPDFRAACGAPPSFPRCDRTAKQVFSARRRPGALASPLAPGVYGDLVVAPGEKAVLAGGGAYVFCNLTVGRGARLAVESAADVFVNGKLRATGIDATPDADVRFFVAGRAALAGRVAARHVCVPDGKLTVKNGNLTGHFAAKSLVLVGTVAAMPRPVGTTGTTTSSTITTTTTLPLAQIRFVSTP